MKKIYKFSSYLLLLFFFLLSGNLFSQTITVDGAGTFEVNGTYTWDGFSVNAEGNPVYQNDQFPSYIHKDFFGLWVISDNPEFVDQENSFYFSFSNDPNDPCPPDQGWEPGFGQFPPPFSSCEGSAICPPEEALNFTNQAQVDAFIEDYPNCTNFQGPVQITGSFVNNLDGLNNLDTVSGVFFVNTTSITSLSEWSNLSAIFGELRVNNTGITDFTGLNNLALVGDINIWSNTSLSSLNGLSDLIPISSKDIVIKNNSALTNLNGLNPLPANSQTLDLHIQDNSNLTDLSALNNVTNIRELHIRDNASLTSLSDLANLSTVRELWIESSALSNLEGLESLSSVSWLLRLECSSLTDLSALESLSHINGRFLLSDMSTLAGLDNLTSIGRELYFVGANTFTDLSGLENLNTIGGLRLEGTNLSSLNGLEVSAIIDIPNTVFTPTINFTSNSNLTDISALEGVTATDLRTLFLQHNTSLSMCSISPICEGLEGGYIQNLLINNNGTNCNSATEITTECNAVTCGPDSELPTAAGTYIGAEVTVDMDGFTYYCDGNGKLLLAIKAPAGWTIPADAVQLKIGATTSEYYSQFCGGSGNDRCFVQNAAGTGMINRHWEIDEDKMTAGSFGFIEVKHFFTNAEYTALNTTLASNGLPALSAVTEMELYNVNPFTVTAMFPGVTDVKPFYAAFVLKNAATSGTTTWVHTTHGTSDHSATFKIYSSLFKAGGGLGGKIK